MSKNRGESAQVSKESETGVTTPAGFEPASTPPPNSNQSGGLRPPLNAPTVPTTGSLPGQPQVCRTAPQVRSAAGAARRSEVAPSGANPDAALAADVTNVFSAFRTSDLLRGAAALAGDVAHLNVGGGRAVAMLALQSELTRRAGQLERAALHRESDDVCQIAVVGLLREIGEMRS